MRVVREGAGEGKGRAFVHGIGFQREGLRLHGNRRSVRFLGKRGQIGISILVGRVAVKAVATTRYWKNSRQETSRATRSKIVLDSIVDGVLSVLITDPGPAAQG